MSPLQAKLNGTWPAITCIAKPLVSWSPCFQCNDIATFWACAAHENCKQEIYSWQTYHCNERRATKLELELKRAPWLVLGSLAFFFKSLLWCTMQLASFKLAGQKRANQNACQAPAQMACVRAVIAAVLWLPAACLLACLRLVTRLAIASWPQ